MRASRVGLGRRGGGGEWCIRVGGQSSVECPYGPASAGHPAARGTAGSDGRGDARGRSSGNDAPRLISATVLEGGPLRARRVFGAPIAGFRAFLDGTQRSLVVGLPAGALPIILGRVAAVVRERRNRRMHTWGRPLVESRLYCPPRSWSSAPTWETLPLAIGEPARRHDATRARTRRASVRASRRGVPSRAGAPRGARAAARRALVQRRARSAVHRRRHQRQRDGRRRPAARWAW